MRNNYTFNNNEFSYNKQRSINGLSLLNVKKIHDDTDYQNEILTICDQFKANKQCNTLQYSTITSPNLVIKPYSII